MLLYLYKFTMCSLKYMYVKKKKKKTVACKASRKVVNAISLTFDKKIPTKSFI